MVKPHVLPAFALTAALTGCITGPDTTSEEYLRVSTYERYSCDRINYERNRVLSETFKLANQQVGLETGNQVALAGPVLYWPDIAEVASGTALEGQFASYKEDYDALTQAGINNRCLSFHS
jgi:hypothetical protein